jgi:hypothetical protein
MARAPVGRPPHLVTAIGGVEGETVLIAALLRQALDDTRSPYPDTRRPARHFLSQTDVVHCLVELIGLDADVWDRPLALTMAERLTRQPT